MNDLAFMDFYALENSCHDIKFQRQARRLLVEGKVSSYEKGELVVQLTTLYYEEDEAIAAANECDDVYQAEKFLRRECELCASVMKFKEVNIMTTFD